MPKKSNASKSNLTKEFLKQLKTIEQNERKQKGKKVSGKRRSGKDKKTLGDGRKSPKKTSGRISKFRDVVSENVKPIPKQPKTVKGRQGKRGTKQNTKKPRLSGSLEIAKRERGKQTIEISFKGVRSISKKVALINDNEALQKEFKKQLKRKGGKPPRGIIIIVRDKKGNEAAHVSIPSFVVNEANVKKELEKFANDLKEEYSQRQQDLADGEPMDDSQGYEDYNPDNIESITIKFIY